MPRPEPKAGRKATPTGHRLTVGDAEPAALHDAAIAVIAAPPDVAEGLTSRRPRKSLRTWLARVEETKDFAAVLR